MPDLGIGVIGLRNIGRAHLRWASEAAGCRLVAMADTDPARLATAHADHPTAAACRDAATLLALPEVDLVALAVPNHLHASLAIETLRQGKHALVEKPLARTVAEAQAMQQAADAAGRLLAVSMNRRFDPSLQAGLQAMRAQRLGRVLRAHTRWTLHEPFAGLWERGDWFLDRVQAGGGPFFDNGIHKLDQALALLGFPAVEEVRCTCSYGRGKAAAAARGKVFQHEDGAVADLRLAGGIPLTVEVAVWHETPGNVEETVIIGERGTLSIRGDAATITSPTGAVETLATPPGVARSTHEHCARVLRGEEALALGIGVALPELRVMEAAYASDARGGAPVSLLRAGAAR